MIEKFVKCDQKALQIEFEVTVACITADLLFVGNWN